jgi:hypothetical protein
MENTMPIFATFHTMNNLGVWEPFSIDASSIVFFSHKRICIKLGEQNGTIERFVKEDYNEIACELQRVGCKV